MKLHLLHCRLILYHLSHQGKPNRHIAFVLLILFMMPVVSLFTQFTQFTEPRGGKVQAKRLEEDTRSRRNCCCCCCFCVASVVPDSVRPHRRQPTRFPRPRDSPGKNTGVRCHFLLQCMKVKSESEVAQSCPTLRDPLDCSPPGSSIHRMFQARVPEWVAIAFHGRNCRCVYSILAGMAAVTQPLSWLTQQP